MNTFNPGSFQTAENNNNPHLTPEQLAMLGRSQIVNNAVLGALIHQRPEEMSGVEPALESNVGSSTETTASNGQDSPHVSPLTLKYQEQIRRLETERNNPSLMNPTEKMAADARDIIAAQQGNQDNYGLAA